MNIMLWFFSFIPSLITLPPIESIKAEDLRAHVYFLSGDELRGREAGTLDEQRAGFYIKEYLQSFGVKPGGKDNSFWQNFRMKMKKSSEAPQEVLAMRNVIGLIEGTDPLLKNEFLILGAHYDHIGLGGFGSLGTEGHIHNGADDNASGTAALLELAQAIVQSPWKRSVVCMFFSGEEKGLLGSEHYCANPIYDLTQTVAMLNMDMLGRGQENYLFVGGAGTGRGLADLITAKAADTPIQLEMQAGGKAPSDNAPFFSRHIPVLFFFTNIHEDYHAPGDDWWKLNYASHETNTRFIYTIAYELGNEAVRREFVDSPGMALPKNFYHLMTEIGKKRKAQETTK